MKKNKWFLNGGRGSGRTFRLLCETYENKIAELEAEVKEWKDKADLWCKTANLKDHNIMINKELKKENAKLKKEVEKHKWNDIFLEDCADYDKKIAEEYTTLQERIADLEAENAELKHTIAELRRDKDNLNTHTKAQEKLSEYRSDQLTKAKELLERLLITSCNSDVLNLLPNCSEVLRVRVEAEQFLSEVEK